MKKAVYVFILIAVAFLLVPEGRDYAGFLLNKGTVDNTNHGWEVKRNNQHKQPDISLQAKDIISKYNGIYVGPPDKKVVYLTIDLGYETGNTGVILDVLKDNNVKATFFTIASYLRKNPEIVDRIVNEGHSLQNHTANYRHLNHFEEYIIKKEIMDMHNMVKDRYGITMKYLRLPYEDWSERVMKIASGMGYKTVFWSIACIDWVEGRDADYIYNSVISNHHNGAVILLHTISKNSPRALNMIIKELKDKGYEFRVLDL